MKRVYLEAGWKPNPLYDELVSCPPEGYEFVVGTSPRKRRAGQVAKSRVPFFLLGALDKKVPLSLIRARLAAYKRIPADIDLIYSCGMLVFSETPWVVDQEYLSTLIGGNIAYFTKYKTAIERAFASEHCKKVICWSEVGKRVILSNLRCGKFQDKLAVVYFAIRKKDFHKSYRDGRLKLLFLGSANLPGEFKIKGGKETLDAFLLLRQRYDNIELVVRSDVPPDIKRKYGNIENLRIIDSVLPRELLEEEYKTADIFVLPAHNTPWMVPLEAMSYELPIVSLDVWGNPEIVADGKTGLLARKSESLPYYTDTFLPHFGTPEFMKAIESPDPAVVADLAAKIGILIENPELRRDMGRAARWEVEHGKFSIQHRNAQLKRMFDEATAPCNAQQRG